MKKDKGGVSPQEIDRARGIDLLTYLQQNEPWELVHVSGQTYCTREHDSLKISNGKWFWFSRGFGGASALDYLVKVKCIDFVEAVRMINGQEHSVTPVLFYDKKPANSKKLLLPEKNADNDIVIKYLMDRGIDMGIITHCIETGILYESLPKHNAIFIGLDGEGIARYAAFRAANGCRILGEAKGSDKHYSFRLVAESSDTVHIFESAIDLMSYATLMTRWGANWKSTHLLSLAGIYSTRRDGSAKIPSALELFLKEHPEVNNIRLHLDNDDAGRNSTAGLIRLLENEFNVVNAPPPRGKDVNEYLNILKRNGEMDNG